MVDNKDIKLQINEYHKLMEELRVEKIELPEQFVAGLLIEKLLDSWSDYKQQLKHKQKQLYMADLISYHHRRYKPQRTKDNQSKTDDQEGKLGPN